MDGPHSRGHRRAPRPVHVLVVGAEASSPISRALERVPIQIAQATREASARPDVVVLEPDPTLAAGSMINAVRSRGCSCPVLVGLHSPSDVSASKLAGLLRTGAAGFVLVPCSSTQLIDAIEVALGGGMVIPPALAPRLLDSVIPPTANPGCASPSARELEVLRAVARGSTNPAIARELNLSRATVRTHLEHLYRKLDVTNRAEAVAEAARLRLLELD